VVAVERLLHLHPIDAIARPGHEAAFVRLVRRTRALLPDLLALREAEIAARGEGEESRRRLERLRRAIDHACAPSAPDPGTALALDGRAVMEILGCGPGPEVGRALLQLAKAVAADPAANTADRLRDRLIAWRSGTGES
jgi:tRNA nucleotidyltransferase (CCA-adding enzyme)